MSTKQFLKTTAIAIMVALVSVPQQTEAQKLKDFQEAMKKPREFAGYYKMWVKNPRSQEKIYNLAKENGIRIIRLEYGRTLISFIPESEWNYYQHEVNYNRTTSDGWSMHAEDRLIIKNLKGSDFKTVGAAYLYNVYYERIDYYNSNQKGYFSKCDNITWTGGVKNGMIDGAGEGYAAVKDNGNVKYYIISGTFKEGKIAGKVFIFTSLSKHHDQINVEYKGASDGMIGYHIRNRLVNKWNYYTFVNDQFSQTIDAQYQAIKQNFKEGKAIVTDRGMDIVIDKKGKFQAIAEGVTEIPNEYFSGWHLTSITIPRSVTKIGQGAFKNCNNLEEVKIQSPSYTIENSAFQGCKSLKSIDLSAYNNTILGGNTFRSCESLATITLSPKIKEIGENAFEDCKSLKSISLPAGLLTLYAKCFKNCTSLTTVVIPNTVTYIGGNAFEKCTALTSASVPSTIPDKIKGYTIFANCNNLKAVSVRNINGTKKQDSNWYWFQSSDPNTPKPTYTASSNSSSSSVDPNSSSIPNYKLEDWQNVYGSFSNKVKYKERTLYFNYEYYGTIQYRPDMNRDYPYNAAGVGFYNTLFDAVAALYFKKEYGLTRTTGKY